MAPRAAAAGSGGVPGNAPLPPLPQPLAGGHMTKMAAPQVLQPCLSTAKCPVLTHANIFLDMHGPSCRLIVLGALASLPYRTGASCSLLM